MNFWGERKKDINEFEWQWSGILDDGFSALQCGAELCARRLFANEFHIYFHNSQATHNNNINEFDQNEKSAWTQWLTDWPKGIWYKLFHLYSYIV